jgi:hypothetical protein
VYLEDSYVLDINIKPASVEFLLSVVLTEKHPLYTAPLPHEQYCYRTARLLFPNVESVDGLDAAPMPSTDATGAIDYGNINEFYRLDEHYYLSGDWGRLKIRSDPPSLQIVTHTSCSM